MSAPLEPLIREYLRQHGRMPLEMYMQWCLSHPEHGYYRRDDPLGAAGDFTTAPEISQMFGELCGLWLHDQALRQQLKTPAMAELGPGRGTLMADMLRIMDSAGAAPSDVHLVEINPALINKQRQRLNGASCDQVKWHETVADLPEQPMLLMANEFFDALPIRQLHARDGKWFDAEITLVGDQLALTLASAETATHLPATSDGSVAENCPAAPGIAGEIARRIAQHGGAALIIDYGKDNPYGDSIQAVRQHRPEDILASPGLADLSAWVDFAILRQAAEAEGAMALGPIPQGTFLKAIGLYQRAETLAASAAPDQRRALAAAVDRLSGSAQMGEVFKVMAIVPQATTLPVAGF